MSALESSVTLDDVFTVVGAKRVPLAAELAGYLALEIAEGATEAAGDVDPRSVYIGEEGSVALVLRQRRDPSTTPGDAEGSIRTILAKLLEASGSQTPALVSSARRRTASGLHVLVEELEAALIPVNRAAGRRALARLAREVKRVTSGVGRNASLSPGEPSPRRPSSPSYTAVRPGAARPAPQGEPRPRTVFVEEATTARRDAIVEPEVAPERVAVRPAPEPAPAPAPPLPVRVEAPPARSLPDASELPTVEFRKEHALEALAAHESALREMAREPTPDPPAGAVPVRSPARPADAAEQGDEVDHLLASFGVSSRGEQAQRNALKALVGLEPTPPPPGSERFDDAPSRRSASGADVESLLAIGSARTPDVAPRGLASPPTSISPALANEPIGAGGPTSAPTVASAVSPAGAAPRSAVRSYRDDETMEANGAEERREGPRAVPTSPSARRLVEMGSRPDSMPPPPDRTLTVFALVILVAGGAAIWWLRPMIFGGGTHPSPTPVVSAAPSPPAAPPRCRSSLVVTDAPIGAELLVRAGQAPVDVERMPIGPRLEFVATAEGYAPKRAVIPAGATWDSGPDGKPRYEVGVQLDHSRAHAGTVDPWPAGEPGSEVGGMGAKNAPGTVHIVATPRGAEVWQVAALGPDAQFDVKCGGDVEVLVAGPTTVRKRLRVPEAAFVSVDGGADRQATVSAR